VSRVAVVTGASRGIGKATALALAQAGWDVVVAAKTEKPHPRLPGTIHETAVAVEKLGRRALAVRTDVREEDDLRALAEKAAGFGTVEVVVHNAGAIWLYPVAETPLRRYDLVMEVNARAAFGLAALFSPGMAERGRGHLVFVSPPVDFEALPGRVAYSLSKFAMTMLGMGLSAELKGRGVSVNSLWPATAIRSAATETFGMGTPEMWRTPEVFADAVVELAKTPPGEVTGRAMTDEQWLRERGVTDFSKYRCVEGVEPPAMKLRDYPSAGRAPR
jgi:citronellol/citronellal dehydrogenase